MQKLFAVIDLLSAPLKEWRRYRKNNVSVSNAAPMGVDELTTLLDGRNLMPIIAPEDWPIWVNVLHGKSVVIIGGYVGIATRRVTERVSQLEELHVYEPVPKFAEQNKNIDERVTVFNEAIWEDNKDITMQVNGDHSYTGDSNRIVLDKKITFEEMTVASISVAQMVSRITNINDYSIIMNCEGAEYTIIRDLMSQTHTPKSILFQSHELKDGTLLQLYTTRLLLAESGYFPVLNLNLAWDIWTKAHK